MLCTVFVKEQVLMMFAGTSWASWIPAESPFHSTGLLSLMPHTIYRSRLRGWGLDWLIQVQWCLSLDVASTHQIRSCSFGITVKIIHQSQAAWECSHLNGIVPFFISYTTRPASGPTPLWRILVVSGNPFLFKQPSRFLQLSPPVCFCAPDGPTSAVAWHFSLSQGATASTLSQTVIQNPFHMSTLVETASSGSLSSKSFYIYPG